MKITSNIDKILNNNKITNMFIALVPFARGKGKTWSVENYYRLIDLIKDKFTNIQIVVLGLKTDFGKIESKKIIDLCGRTSIKDIASILSRCKIAVGADTGPMHLAAILNTPSIFIFGHSDINETAPCIGRFSLLVNKDNKDAINNIKPETVFLEIKKWIK
jgi:ADP-heptose:LPS heptosyltransferase